MKAFKYIKCEVKKYNNESFQIYKNVKLKSITMKAFKIYKMWK